MEGGQKVGTSSGVIVFVMFGFDLDHRLPYNRLDTLGISHHHCASNCAHKQAGHARLQRRRYCMTADAP